MKTTIRIQMVSIKMQGEAPEIVKALTEMVARLIPEAPPPPALPKRKRLTKAAKPNGQH